ncbi:UDP-N-acetylmuramoylalanine-D-glutamate ligase [Propionispora sp. 2/2-37]|uniref:UDP-N-acetylmuramoyl-L-alanine--D-glutamate ligase n=1 Tax=Propionispora sp. 2/2-37 TaxID=1677858 RepID=UPI0006BB656E|nr:UDP-N-acetylmuramoyl-L-alanine--D-glutamate ligase [Propionispora sp. 2/2-37]CUH94034.1 UDP-N-acetylmuramoylalanine-D-glutamate ligase [Propionispora sp. 2/2-37]
MSVKEFQNKNVLVLGAGISGMSVAHILQNIGAVVTLSDSKCQEEIRKDFSKLIGEGVTLALGKQNELLLTDFDYIVVSPGISIYSPLISKARNLGIEVISEVEVAYRLCRAPIVAVTGTNGKTTTTTLIGDMLKTTNQHVVVGGNIGAALSQEVAEVPAEGAVIAEISSFQLEGVKNFHPRIAAILNITPDHLDRHKTMQTYIAMKERIFATQGPEDFLILNYDDHIVRDMARKVSSQVLYFSRREEEMRSAVYVKNDIITIDWNEKVYPVCSVREMKLFGAHNVENALAACGVAFFAGVPVDKMAAVLRTFEGVEHRIELVATINQVTYYNDSKATNPESSIKALEAFPGNIVLIAGGRDKNTDLTEFMNLVKHKTDAVIFIGEAAERFTLAAEQNGVKHIYPAETLEAAVDKAYQIARAPQVVLLSPACSSYDMFTNYEERGREFKRLVQKLG